MNITPPVRNKIQKYIDTHELSVQQDTIYILCTDSKGRYLKPFIPHTYQDRFIWWDKGGRKTEDGVNFIKFNLDKVTRLYPQKQIKIIFWHGTCDITYKTPNRLIYLKNPNNNEVYQMFRNIYNKLISITHTYNNVKLCLLEIPPISTQIWNYQHADPNWETIDDSNINIQVQIHNEIIKHLNGNLIYRSPNFNQDYIDSKKYKPNTQTTYFFNFMLSKDGVHPHDILANKWAIRILETVNRQWH